MSRRSSKTGAGNATSPTGQISTEIQKIIDEIRDTDPVAAVVPTIRPLLATYSDASARFQSSTGHARRLLVAFINSSYRPFRSEVLAPFIPLVNDFSTTVTNHYSSAPETIRANPDYRPKFLAILNVHRPMNATESQTHIDSTISDFESIRNFPPDLRIDRASLNRTYGSTIRAYGQIRAVFADFDKSILRMYQDDTCPQIPTPKHCRQFPLPAPGFAPIAFPPLDESPAGGGTASEFEIEAVRRRIQQKRARLAHGSVTPESIAEEARAIGERRQELRRQRAAEQDTQEQEWALVRDFTKGLSDDLFNLCSVLTGARGYFDDAHIEQIWVELGKFLEQNKPDGEEALAALRAELDKLFEEHPPQK
jgi:hypothetical protein